MSKEKVIRFFHEKIGWQLPPRVTPAVVTNLVIICAKLF